MEVGVVVEEGLLLDAGEVVVDVVVNSLGCLGHRLAGISHHRASRIELAKGLHRGALARKQELLAVRLSLLVARASVSGLSVS